MARNWLLAHWRRIAMQAALCAVLLATIGLAALVTHEKRLALRLPLIDPPRGIGQLVAQWPRGWSQPAFSRDGVSRELPLARRGVEESVEVLPAKPPSATTYSSSPTSRGDGVCGAPRLCVQTTCESVTSPLPSGRIAIREGTS